MGLIQLLFGFNGRINRMQYWLGCLGAGFGGGMLIFMSALLALPSPDAPKGAAVANAPMMLLFWGLIVMALAWIGLALQWKRFHDRGRPGWIAFAPMLPMTMLMVSVFTGAMSGAPFHQVAAGAQLWILVLWAINLWFFIDLGCLAGEPGPNKYGDPPGSGGGSLAPSRPHTPAPQATAMSSLFGAQSAMDRAIAEHQTLSAMPRPATATATASPGGAPSFGRKQSS